MSAPDMIRQHSLRTGDTVEGVIRAPGENERYFALTKVEKINFEHPGQGAPQSRLRQPDAALPE